MSAQAPFSFRLARRACFRRRRSPTARRCCATTASKDSRWAPRSSSSSVRELGVTAIGRFGFSDQVPNVELSLAAHESQQDDSNQRLQSSRLGE